MASESDATDDTGGTPDDGHSEPATTPDDEDAEDENRDRGNAGRPYSSRWPFPGLDPAVMRSIRRQAEDAFKAFAPVEKMNRRLAVQAQTFLRAYDLSRVREQIAAAIPKIDLSALAAAAQRLREQLPPNWEDLSSYDVLAEIAKDDGLPVAWVPRSEVLALVVAAADRQARMGVLSAHRAEVLEDCRLAINEVSASALLDRVPLALEAVDAFDAGMSAAAQTLAVALTESLLTEHVAKGRKYERLAKDVVVDTDEINVFEVRTVFTLLPVSRFYTTWYSNTGTPPPDALSRHVTVHHARADHLTEENALVAVMLLTSLLRDLHEVLVS